jgi:hypothetical protein
MEIIRYVSEYDMGLFNRSAINITQLIIRSIADITDPFAKPDTRIQLNKKTIPIKIIIPEGDK